MRKTLKWSLFILLFSSFISVEAQSQNDSIKEIRTQKKYELRSDFEYVNQIPYDLQTPEQEALSMLLVKTYLENTVVENKRLVFKLSREELVKLGIPDPYFEVLLNNAIEANTFMANVEEAISTDFYESWESKKQKQLDALSAGEE